MRTAITILALATLTLNACKEEKKTPDVQIISAIANIQNQASEIDTSLYSLKKLVYVDSLRTDTISFPREQFRAEAVDFLSLPDISAKEYAGRYTETKEFDEQLNRAMFIYTAIKPEKELIQRQEVLIEPDADGGKIKTIFISTLTNTRDSAIEKKLLWKMNESFQVIKVTQLPGQPEAISRKSVSWNGSEFQ